MPALRYDASTVVWEDGVVHHRLEEFPELTEESRGDYTVRAYEDRPESVDEMFRDAVAHGPDREAFVFPEMGVRITYQELESRVASIAGGLHDAGVEPGDRVMIHLSNRREFVETYFACARLNAVSVPTNTRLTAGEVGYHIDDADPAAVVSEQQFADVLREAGPDLPSDRTFLADDPAEFRPFADLLEGSEPDVAAPDQDDVAILMYTSGTTGDPKGCVGRHFNMVNGALNWKHSFESGDGLRSMVTVPMFHGTGLMANTLQTVSCAGTTVILDEYSPEAFLSTIEEESVEWIIAVPTNYILAAEKADPSEYDLSDWRVAVYGGAPMPATAIPRLRDAFPDLLFADGYGATEHVAGLVTMCPDEYADDYAHTIGLPAGPVEVKVVDEEHDVLGPGEVGELVVKSPTVVDRYLGLPELTAEEFEDGWHYTGDLAAIDEDGFVELKGRDSDMIVRGGENIYALDVEEALVSSEKVLEAAVVGFPDDVLGERVLAAVVPKDGVRLTEEDLQAVCEERLADYKRPAIFRIVDSLPRNPNGKVMKDELLPEPLAFGIRAG
jgi:long-chain acyl-CoA synthetase